MKFHSGSHFRAVVILVAAIIIAYLAVAIPMLAATPKATPHLPDVVSITPDMPADPMPHATKLYIHCYAYDAPDNSGCALIERWQVWSDGSETYINTVRDCGILDPCQWGGC